MATAELARELLSRHGACVPQDVSGWDGPFDLPDPLRRFYADVGPHNIDVVGYGNSTTLPSLAHLWERQAGYRWDGLTNEPIDDWHDNWLVVADEGADPYIYDIGAGRVLFAQHGAGEWDAGEIYQDLNTMAACIATLGCVIIDSDDFVDENCDINPACRAGAMAAMPLHEAHADISIAPLDSGRTRVTWGMDYRVKYGPFGWILGQTMMKMMMGKILDGNLNGLANKVQSDRNATS